MTMWRPRTPFRLAGLAVPATACALVFFAGAASGDSHEPAWDQEKVTQLADTLAVSLHEVVNDPAMSGKQPTAFQDRNLHAALIDLRQMSNTARGLLEQLKGGASPEQTAPVFRQILLTRQDVRMYAENSEISKSVQSKAANAIEALDQLQTYFAPY
jgi:hypothetical protein